MNSYRFCLEMVNVHGEEAEDQSYIFIPAFKRPVSKHQTISEEQRTVFRSPCSLKETRMISVEETLRMACSMRGGIFIRTGAVSSIIRYSRGWSFVRHAISNLPPQWRSHSVVPVW
jgi:hypothetical protein